MTTTASNFGRGAWPFFTIWAMPRRTMRAILETNPRRLVIPLAMLSGFGSSLDQASGRSVGDTLPLWAILALALVLGPLGGLVTLYVGGFLFRLTGSWLGGRATSVEVRAAIAWSSVPLIWSLFLLWPPELALLGHEMFTTATPTLDANPALAIPLLFLILLEVFIGMWSIVVFVRCLAEAHGFSSWRGLGAAAIGSGIVLAIILAIALPIAILAVALGA